MNIETIKFKNIVQQIARIPEQSFNALANITSEVNFPKGHLLFRAGRVNNNIYIVGKGISRAFVQMGTNEVTFGFFGEGKVLLSILSYVEGTAGYENIELLEDCILYQLRKHDLEELYSKDIFLANWGRKLADQSFVETEKQMIARQFKSTTERYEDFTKNFPDLLNRIKLKHIASYLGMTQVTLSRIRAKN